MRLTLYWRGIDLIDIEAHLLRRRDDEEEVSEETNDAEPIPFGFGVCP